MQFRRVNNRTTGYMTVRSYITPSAAFPYSGLQEPKPEAFKIN